MTDSSVVADEVVTEDVADIVVIIAEDEVGVDHVVELEVDDAPRSPRRFILGETFSISFVLYLFCSIRRRTGMCIACYDGWIAALMHIKERLFAFVHFSLHCNVAFVP